MLPIQRSDSALYPKEYARLKTHGVQFLIFRDIPDLIKKHVIGKKTLDYGCGVGRSTSILKSCGLNVEGVDINQEMVNFAKTTGSDINYQAIKSGEIPAPDAYYDLVFTSLVLQEVSSKDELKKVVAEFARVLKPSGTLIVVTTSNIYNADWVGMNTEFEENKNLSSGKIVKVWFQDQNFGLDHYYWSEQDYQEIINSAGLSLVETCRPCGRDGEGFEWKTEKKRAPWIIYVAKKL